MCQTKKKSLPIARLQNDVSLACVCVVALVRVCITADVVVCEGNEAKVEGSFSFSRPPFPLAP